MNAFPPDVSVEHCLLCLRVTTATNKYDQSAAYRFAKQYDCMDVPEVFDPNTNTFTNGRQKDGDSDAGSNFGGTNGGSGSRDMVATLGDVKPSIREFEGKSERSAFAFASYVPCM